MSYEQLPVQLNPQQPLIERRRIKADHAISVGSAVIALGALAVAVWQARSSDRALTATEGQLQLAERRKDDETK